MAKPVILAVDDDPQVLRAAERDLRRRYARDYRVLRADSGEFALDTLGKLKLRGDPVSLFLVDQRIPKRPYARATRSRRRRAASSSRSSPRRR